MGADIETTELRSQIWGKCNLKINSRPWSQGDSVPQSGLLLLRHAHRQSDPDPQIDADFTISERGIKESQNLGSAWEGAAPSHVLSSPEPRCQETSNALVDSAGWKLKVRTLKVLSGYPFICDWEKWKGHLSKHGFKILKEYVNGEKVYPGMRPRDVGVKDVLSELNQWLNDDLVICVTHDFTIANISGFIGYKPIIWSDFLSGLYLELNNVGGLDL